MAYTGAGWALTMLGNEKAALLGRLNFGCIFPVAPIGGDRHVGPATAHRED